MVFFRNSGVLDSRRPLDAHRVRRERHLGLDSTIAALASLGGTGLVSMLLIDRGLVDTEVLRTALAVYLAAVPAVIDILRYLHRPADVAVSPR